MHGYDSASGQLVTWSREFTFAGRTDSPPGDSFFSKEPMAESAFGAHFLSGQRRSQLAVWKDGSMERHFFIKDSTRLPTAGYVSESGVVLFGPSVSRPEEVTDFAMAHRNVKLASLHVCPLLSELPAFGVLALELCQRRLDHPRRADLFVRQLGPAGRNFHPTYERLPDDCYGRMAQELLKGCVCLNEAKKGPGVSPFHGRLIHLDYRPGSVMLVSRGTFPTLFPNVTHCLQTASTCVPVRLELHRPDLGVDGPVDVFTASDFCLDLAVFQGFLGVMSGRDHAFSSPADVPTDGKIVRVLRYNGFGTL